MLVFPGALRALECAFHDVGFLERRYLREARRLVNSGSSKFGGGIQGNPHCHAVTFME